MLFGFMFNRSVELRKAEDRISRDYTCFLISSLMTSAFITGDGVIINTTIDYNATINSTVSPPDISVGDINCLPSDYNVPTERLDKGIIKIENTNNEIDIDNV